MKNSLCSILFFLLAAIQLNAASDKLLESFSTQTQFFTSYVPAGAGSGVTLSNDNTVGNFTEGTAALKVIYNFNAVASGFLEVYRGYGSNTLDLSFMPNGLSFQIKSSGGNSDQYRLMLYEDINMNGNPFETGDEVYQSALHNLSSTWTTTTVLYNTLTALVGGGNGTLDLDRIVAWRIVIVNGNGTAHAGTVWVDNLKQLTSHNTPTTGTTVLNGAFFQLWNSGAGCSCGQWSQVQWDAELQKLKDAGQTKVFVQYGVWESGTGQGNAWYSGSTFTYSNPTLDRIFSAAATLGMKVVVGLYFSETWNTADKSLASTYSSLITPDQTVINEVWTKFGTNAAFDGWYIPQEINDSEWPAGSSKQTLLFNWLKAVSDYAKTKSTTKKVYIAPYFGPNIPADALESWYNTLFTTATNIDVVIPQDGVGTTRTDGDVDVPHYFAAIRDAAQANGRTFGATIETFRQTDGWPINANSFAAVPASIASVKSQLWEAGVYATELVQFEYPYMQGARGTSYQQLYDDYLSYYQSTIPTSVQRPSASKEALLYPVPSTGIIYIEYLPSTAGTVKIFNAAGEMISQQQLQPGENEISLQAQVNGLYYYSVTDDRGIVGSGKFVLMK